MLRNADLTDLDSIVALECASYRVPPFISKIQRPQMRNEWESAIREDQVFCMNGPDGALIGALHVSGQDKTSTGVMRTLVSLMVDPAYQKGGLGTRLLSQFLQSCDRDGCSVGLKVDPKNSGAIHLYEKYNFKSLGRREDGLVRMLRTPETAGLDDPAILLA